GEGEVSGNSAHRVLGVPFRKTRRKRRTPRGSRLGEHTVVQLLRQLVLRYLTLKVQLAVALDGELCRLPGALRFLVFAQERLLGHLLAVVVLHPSLGFDQQARLLVEE